MNNLSAIFKSSYPTYVGIQSLPFTAIRVCHCEFLCKWISQYHCICSHVEHVFQNRVPTEIQMRNVTSLCMSLNEENTWVGVLIVAIIIIIKYVAYWQVQGLIEDTYARLINCRLHLFRSSASSFSSQYLLLFLKSSRTCVLLLPTPFYFRHLSFNGIMKEAISSQNTTDPIGFST